MGVGTVGAPGRLIGVCFCKKLRCPTCGQVIIRLTNPALYPWLNQSRLGVCRGMRAPDYYRQRAVEARRAARAMTREDLREQMETVAKEYDEMAADSEALRRLEDRPKG